MVNVKTDPLNALPPTIGGWAVVFTRKVVAGVAADVGYISTGVTYDPDYEYFAGSCPRATPSPNVSGPIFAAYFAPVKSGGTSAIFVSYLPDGATDIGSSSLGTWGYWCLPAQSNVAAIASAQVIYAGYILLRIQPSGLFETQWDGDAFKDGHCVIARRRRYG